jgi:hypothetical protein
MYLGSYEAKEILPKSKSLELNLKKNSLGSTNVVSSFTPEKMRSVINRFFGFWQKFHGLIEPRYPLISRSVSHSFGSGLRSSILFA